MLDSGVPDDIWISYLDKELTKLTKFWQVRWGQSGMMSSYTFAEW